MDIPTDVDFRKAQEAIATALSGGYLKELAVLHATLFGEYRNHGFNDEQALRLVIAFGIPEKDR